MGKACFKVFLEKVIVRRFFPRMFNYHFQNVESWKNKFTVWEEGAFRRCLIFSRIKCWKAVRETSVRVLVLWSPGQHVQQDEGSFSSERHLTRHRQLPQKKANKRDNINFET